MSERGFSVEQLLAMEPGSTVLTRQGLDTVQKAMMTSEISHGVARSDVSQFADGKFQVVKYWVIFRETGVMMHSFLHLHVLDAGNLKEIPAPIRWGRSRPC